ncbi:MAG: plasmid mobilization protein [Pseudonocardiaceae bacterium]
MNGWSVWIETVMTGRKQPDEMSDAELAEYHWQHRDDGLGEEVEFEVAKPLRVTMSFRLPAQEADAIRAAATAAGTSLSEWIRWATMRATHDTEVPPPRHAAISRARELLLQAEHELGNV